MMKNNNNKKKQPISYHSSIVIQWTAMLHLDVKGVHSQPGYQTQHNAFNGK